MIVIRLCGGLGNQLFQYAAGRRLAHVHRAELILDLSWYAHTPSSDTPRAYELGRYPIQARLATKAEAVWCRLHQGRYIRRLPFLPRRWRHCLEKRFDFNPSVLDLPDNTYLDGYWQSHHYFDEVADLIRAEFYPLASFGVQDNKVAALIADAATGAVSLHVRRGDYVTHNAAAETHGLCSIDYYKAALARVASLVKEPQLFVFSDDPAWTRENLPLPNTATFIDHNGSDAAFQDLRLMSLCHHHITANSSFSWWGGWLNPRKDKIVVTPRKWFMDERNIDSLIPLNWICL